MFLFFLLFLNDYANIERLCEMSEKSHFAGIQKPLQKPVISAFEPHFGYAILDGPLVAAVESDIVGYTTMTMEAGKWYQVSTPFRPLETSSVTTVNDVFSSGLAVGDTLMILDSKVGKYNSQLYWIPEKKAWCDKPIAAIAVPSTEVLAPGQAVYIHKSSAADVVFSGKVVATEVSFGLPEGNAWSQVAAVWPEPMALNDIEWDGMQSGDTLMILDPEIKAYKNQLYWIPEKNAWCDKPVSVIAVPSTEVLEPGQAVFVHKKSKGTGKLLAK